MKTKSLLLAFAGLGLFACTNEDLNQGVDNSGDRSIVIKLDGLTASRVIGDPTSGADAAKVATTLSNVAIVLSDGANVFAVQKLNSTDNVTEWSQLTSSGSGYIIHEVSSHVRQVHVIGNYVGNSTLAAWVDGTGARTVSAMKNLVVQANTQQTFGNVTLYGEDVALETVSGGDTNGQPTHPSAPEGESTTNTLLKADVALKHLVSRIEIGNIQCENLGTMYKELTLKYIGLLNYYNQTTIGGTASVPMTLDNVLEPTVGNATPGEGKFSWSNTSTENVYSWAWDKIADNTKLSAGNTVWNPTKTNDGDGKFVYQFIPNQVSGKNFNVKLYLDATENNNSNTISAFHTVTANFTNDTDFKYESGKIYRVNFKFKEENIGPWNPSEQICVKVNVTVDDWTIVDVTPTFE